MADSPRDAPQTVFPFCVQHGMQHKFRETRLFITAPVANNLVLPFVGQHVLGMPRSY